MSGALLAALDLGSNSFHLLVARDLGDGGIEPIASRRIMLRLAEQVAAGGALGEDGMRRAGEAVAELLDAARTAGASHVIAVATSALREASDGDALLAALRAEHGLAVAVVDGMGEAYLSLRGMVETLDVGEADCLLGLDLGGGSFEIAYGGRGPLVAGATLPLGAARMGRRLRHDPPRLVDLVALHAEAFDAVRPLAKEVRTWRRDRSESGRPRAAGTAGAIRDLGKVALGLDAATPPAELRGAIVSRQDLEQALALLCSMPTQARLQVRGVSEQRADMLPAGGVVLVAAMEAFGLEQLELSDWGIREGVLLDLRGEQHVVGDQRLTPL